MRGESASPISDTGIAAGPYDVFWIWDDVRRRPMSSPREVALIFVLALFAGGWMLVFFLSTTAAMGFDLLR